jgi:hypothetical protein
MLHKAVQVTFSTQRYSIKRRAEGEILSENRDFSSGSRSFGYERVIIAANLPKITSPSPFL